MSWEQVGRRAMGLGVGVGWGGVAVRRSGCGDCVR